MLVTSSSSLLSRGKKNVGDKGVLNNYFCSVFRKNEKSCIQIRCFNYVDNWREVFKT